jgi:hypothetical protein
MAFNFTNAPLGFLPSAPTTGSGSVDEATVLELYAASFSDGRDGDADLDGTNTVPWATLSGSTYTAIRIPVPRDLRVRAGITLKPAQFAGPWCSGDVLVEGTISADGNDASGATAGSATAAGTLPATIAGGAGGAAGGNNNGTQGGAATVEWPTAGRFGGAAGGAGASSSGGATATISALSATRGTTHGGVTAFGAGSYLTNLGVNTTSCGGGGSGGGGNASGAGGGGGASGGILSLSGRSLTVTATGVVRANGGAGAAGGTNGGGGSGGAGGRIYANFGTVTLADSLLSMQVRGGSSGAAGTGGSYSNCGLAGEISYLSGKPSPMATRHNRVSLTSAEMSAAIVAGVLDVSGSFVVGSDAGRSTGVVNTGTGGGGFSIFEMTTPDGEISLRFDATNYRLNLTVRSVVVVSTADINATTAQGPCFQPFVAGDTIDWRIWYDPAGGARSMGIRWFVNRCGGYDEIGTASGSPLAAATAGSALSSSTTAGSWGPAPSYILATRTTAVIASVVIMGDSICAPRRNSTGWDGVSVGSRCSWSTQVCFSLAVQGAKLTDQLTGWQAYPGRGNAAVLAVIFQLGHNDINAGDSSATVTTNAQAIVTDVAAQNPTAKIVISKLSPSYSVWSAAQRTIWDAYQDNINGTGGTPITGVDARATLHVATMGDAAKVLKERSEDSDFTHPNFWGRSLNARSIRTAYDTTGLAA